ncbi:MAG: hypothetical protein GWN45_02970, partial [Gammaproteobacteria bacterium]|nr:hypothetical protein [Gammaproteobacteria bacterium]
GFGDAGTTAQSCLQPDGYVAEASDCDDASAATFPGAAPQDGLDDCMKDADEDDWGDATPPPGVVPGTDCDDNDFGANPDSVWYADADGDGYGDPGLTQTVCLRPAGYVTDGTDCDDTSPTAAVTFPGAAPNDSAAACMKDADGDDWGDATPPAGVTAGTDCDDDPSTGFPTHPGAAPKDDPAACMTDVDGDDWGEQSPAAGVVAGT